MAPGRTVEVKPAVEAELRDRMLGILVSQTVDILDRDIGAAADLDLGCRLALGFKSGPLDIMRRRRGDRGERMLARLAQGAARVAASAPADRRLPGFSPLRAGRSDRRRHGRDLAPARSAKRAARRDNRRDPWCHPRRRARRQRGGLCHHRLWPACVLAPAPTSGASRPCSATPPRPPSTRATVRGCWFTSNDGEAGRRRAERDGARRRARTGAALPRHGRVRDAWLQLPEITLGIVPASAPWSCLTGAGRRRPRCSTTCCAGPRS